MRYIDEVLQVEEKARKQDYNSELSLQEKQSIRKYISMLLEKAKPNNWAWKKLEQRFGFDGDVSMGDFGEPERRIKQ